MLDKMKGYLMEVVIKKVAPRAAQVAAAGIAGILAGPHVAPWMDKFGVQVNQAELVVGISSMVGAGLEWAWHHIGQKAPSQAPQG